MYNVHPMKQISLTCQPHFREPSTSPGLSQLGRLGIAGSYNLRRSPLCRPLGIGCHFYTEKYIKQIKNWKNKHTIGYIDILTTSFFYKCNWKYNGIFMSKTHLQSAFSSKKWTQLISNSCLIQHRISQIDTIWVHKDCSADN